MAIDRLAANTNGGQGMEANPETTKRNLPESGLLLVFGVIGG